VIEKLASVVRSVRLIVKLEVAELYTTVPENTSAGWGVMVVMATEPG